VPLWVTSPRCSASRWSPRALVVLFALFMAYALSGYVMWPGEARAVVCLRIACRGRRRPGARALRRLAPGVSPNASPPGNDAKANA